MDSLAGDLIGWIVNGITLILVIIAIGLAANKKKIIALFVLIIGNAIALFVFLSPLVAWIVSIICIIWVSRSQPQEQVTAPTKQKTKKQLDSSTPKRNIIGPILGIIIGIGLVAGPIIGYLRQEASLKDPTTQGILILCAVIGAFMIINGIFNLLKKDNESSESSPISSVPTKTNKSESYSQSNEDTNKKIRCRFCKKLYSQEYNGCPYCKKK